MLLNDYSGLEYLLPMHANYVTKKLGKPTNLDTVSKEKIDMLQKQKEMRIMERSTLIPNKEAAISYAIRHAENPNPNYRYFHRGDCTNFVSQIMEAGGRAQEPYYSHHLSYWWHYGNVYSRVWTVADTFVRHFGLQTVTRDHMLFSMSLSRGSIIAYDENSDGNWDHVAFVVQDDNYHAVYEGKRYFDYKVAQHSSDYLRWASSPDNRWDKLEDEGYTYGVVR